MERERRREIFHFLFTPQMAKVASPKPRASSRPSVAGNLTWKKWQQPCFLFHMKEDFSYQLLEHASQDLFQKGWERSLLLQRQEGAPRKKRPEEMVEVVSFMHHLREGDKGEREERNSKMGELIRLGQWCLPLCSRQNRHHKCMSGGLLLPYW